MRKITALTALLVLSVADPPVHAGDRSGLASVRRGLVAPRILPRGC